VARYRLSTAAELQLGEILDWSEERFGVAARDRYGALMLAALQAVAEDPRQANVHWRRIRKHEIGIYHIMHSRIRVPDAAARVGQPRHYVVFSLGADGIVEILGFIHDSMLLGRAFRRLARRRAD
jgi:toxin ParE1/3/4